jgi:O-antigen/teichoic acid export membrane protein
MQRKFRVLRVVGSLFKILAWLSLILGLLLAIFLLISPFIGLALPDPYEGIAGPIVSGIVGFIAVGLMSVFYFLTLYATGQGIHLFLAIEENTRETAVLLRGLAQEESPAAPEAYAPPPPPV